jgi:hypothetical protein
MIKRLLVFIVLFVSSTGLVIWYAGGVTAPVPTRSQTAPGERTRQEDLDMMPIEIAEARGLSIGQLQGTSLRIFDEVLGPDGFRSFPRALFRFDEVEPLSRESVRVHAPVGRFFGEDGDEIARVGSEDGILRMTEQAGRVSIVELGGDVRLEETIEDGASLASESLVIEIEEAKGKPNLRAPGRVEIRKQGLVVSGNGFRGDTLLNDFEISRNVRLELAGDSTLLLPDLLTTDSPNEPDPDADGAVLIDSPGSLRIRVTESAPPSGQEARPESSKSGWGVEEAIVDFVDRTYLTRGSQTLETGRLRIRLRWQADPDDPEAGRFVATGFEAGGDVRISDEGMNLTCGEFSWTGEGDSAELRFLGTPTFVLSNLGGSSLLASSSQPDSTSQPGRRIAIRAGDRILLRPDASGRRRIDCSGGVWIGEEDPEEERPPGPGPRPEAEKPGLSARSVAITVEDRDGGLDLLGLDAGGDVKIRDPMFELSGEAFTLRRVPPGGETLTMTENPLLVFAGENLGEFDLEMAPESESNGKESAPPAGAGRVEARAGERIVLVRRANGSMKVDFAGGFAMDRFVGLERLSRLTADAMSLDLEPPGTPSGSGLSPAETSGGSLSVSAWTASGKVLYTAPDGIASGSLLMYISEEEVIALTGTPARIEIRASRNEPPQLLEARKIRYDRRSGRLRASVGVIGTFVTALGISEGLTGRPEKTGGEPSTVELHCTDAELGFREAEHDGVRKTILSTFDAAGDVWIDADDYRARADRITYSDEEALVTVFGTVEKPAEAFMRNPRYPDEDWDSLKSTRILVLTDEERTVCPEGGTVAFRLEDLLAARGRDSDSGEAPRFPTVVTARDEISFARNRDVRFVREVRARQTDEAGEEIAVLECDDFRAWFEPAGESGDAGDEPAEPSASREFRIQRAVCDGNVRVRHSKIVADADRLELLPTRSTVRLEGRRRPAVIKTTIDSAKSSFIEYNYRTGELESGPFATEVKPGDRETP